MGTRICYICKIRDKENPGFSYYKFPAPKDR